MATFLVTGGAGFIGLNTVSYLSKQHKVIGIDNFVTAEKSIYLPVLAELEQHRNVDFYELDATNYQKLGTIFRRYCIDYVIHLAAIPSVQRSVQDPSTVIQNNVTATLNILEWARQSPYLKKVVYAGSSSYYGGRTVRAVGAEAAPLCRSPYAASKAAGELLVNAYFHTYSLPTIVLRYFNVFGPYQNPRSTYAAVIPAFISKVLKDEQPIIYGTGEQSRDFTFVENVAAANYLAAVSDKQGETYDVGCGQSTNLLELLNLINHLLDRHVEPIFAPSRNGDVLFSCADIETIQERIGYMVGTPLYEGLSRTIKYYKESRPLHG